ncbi:MAG: hypothetical protein IPJ41_00865 [Phycisphaerales bacterium]|nr:hypothetical protein [Phycisphaerales bacterium]
MQHWTQILVLVLAFGGPVLGGVLNWLKKQREARERQKKTQAAQLESLRTGRPVGSTESARVSVQPRQQTAQERAAELIRRRQAQIEELRRRQQAARTATTGTRGQPSPPTTPRPGPARATPQARPTGPARATNPQFQRPQKPQRNPQQPPTIARNSAQSQPLPAARLSVDSVDRSVSPSRAQPVDDVAKSSIHELQVDPHVVHPATEGSRPPVQVLGHRMTGADWRRFIVARELIDPPLSLRSPGEGPLPQL